MGVRLVAGSRAVQQQQLQTWCGRGNPREGVVDVGPGGGHVDIVAEPMPTASPRTNPGTPGTRLRSFGQFASCGEVSP
jgi:hypothetical protein